MANTFMVKVVTPDGEVWSGPAVSVILPGQGGYLGVWPGHEPLVTVMDIGSLLIKTPSEQVITLLAVAGGFAQVTGSEVTILAESAELAEQIDTIRATKSEERARERLSGKFADVDIERAQVALRKASARRRVAEAAKGKPVSMV